MRGEVRGAAGRQMTVDDPRASPPLWIPASAGMTNMAHWIPACAGMTWCGDRRSPRLPAPCIPRSYRSAHSRPFRRDERGRCPVVPSQLVISAQAGIQHA